MALMRSSKSGRKEYLDRITFEMLARKPEHRFRLRVRKHDPAIMIHDDHGIRGRVEKRTEISFEPIRKTD